MKKITSSTSVTSTIPTGSYEMNDITDFIYNKLKDYNLENTFKIQSNNNTLQVEITTMRESVYFNKERSVGQLFGQLFGSTVKRSSLTLKKKLFLKSLGLKLRVYYKRWKVKQ